MTYNIYDWREFHSGGANARAASLNIRFTVDGREVRRVFFADVEAGYLLAYGESEPGVTAQHPGTLRPIVEAHNGVIVVEDNP